MADVLSQSEVESLLAALDPASSAPEQSSGMSTATQRRGDPDNQVSVYDFKRPERVSKEQMRAFQALHEGFSREFGASLSGMLRTIVEAKLISVDQLTYSEFVFSLENPTCFNLLYAKGLDGNIILDLNPSILYPVIDRLLGGAKSHKTSFPTRPLTEIELRLVARLTEVAIKGLEKSWSNICDLELSTTQVESNPQLVQIVPPNEVIVLISFEISMGDSRGIMNLCIPFNTIEPLSGKLSSDTWSAYTRRVADPRQKLSLETGITQAKVEMVVQMAETTITTHDLTHLAVGDVIMTEKSKDKGLTIMVEDRPTFLAYSGQVNGHKAVRIAEKLIRPEDEVEQKLLEMPQEEEPANEKAEAK